MHSLGRCCVRCNIQLSAHKFAILLNIIPIQNSNMGLKELKDFSAEEVGAWLTAGGLGEHAPKFVSEGVDGDLLLSLTADDMKSDLGLSSLQAKKVLKNIEFGKTLREKDLKDYSAEEVGMWLTAGGLGEHAPKFVSEGVDGDLLLSLTAEDLKSDLGLSSIQAKKVLKNVESSQMVREAAESGEEEVEELREHVQEMAVEEEEEEPEEVVEEEVVEEEVVEEEVVEEEVVEEEVVEEAPVVEEPVVEEAPAPVKEPDQASAPKPAPTAAPTSAPKPKRGQVIRNGAKGAAGGAAAGAIVGAIVPGMSAADGAKAGAAVGGAGGGAKGLRDRRQGRLAARRQ
ncbi:hypothetical protein ACHAXT_000218 [Thalassiosira profunda]